MLMLMPLYETILLTARRMVLFSLKRALNTAGDNAALPNTWRRRHAGRD
jgi:hypothetical protein